MSEALAAILIFIAAEFAMTWAYYLWLYRRHSNGRSLPPGALKKLLAEAPTLRIMRDRETGELVMVYDLMLNKQ